MQGIRTAYDIGMTSSRRHLARCSRLALRPRSPVHYNLSDLSHLNDPTRDPAAEFILRFCAIVLSDLGAPLYLRVVGFSSHPGAPAARLSKIGIRRTLIGRDPFAA